MVSSPQPRYSPACHEMRCTRKLGASMRCKRWITNLGFDLFGTLEMQCVKCGQRYLITANGPRPPVITEL